mgnify:CR=1 FL=1
MITLIILNIVLLLLGIYLAFLIIAKKLQFSRKVANSLVVIALSFGLLSVGYAAKQANDNHKSQQEKQFSSVSTEINGHYYLIFLKGHEEISVVHDPDCNCKTPTSKQESKQTFTEWSKLQLAIAMTESRFNPLVEGKNKDRGIFQQTPVYVREANRILGKQVYTHNDSFDIDKSIEMFNIVQDHYNKAHDIDKAIHLHNHGSGNGYSREVMKNMTFIERMENVRNAVIEYESYN